MKLDIPEVGEMEINTVILDLNGTLTVNGLLIDGVKDKILKLKEKGLKIVLFSGDTRGTASGIADELEIDLVITKNGESKKNETEKLNAETCVSIGNGLIDLPMFKISKLTIATLQGEGVSGKLLAETDIVVNSINDALNLLLDEKSLISTLRR